MAFGPLHSLPLTSPLARALPCLTKSISALIFFSLLLFLAPEFATLCLKSTLIQFFQHDTIHVTTLILWKLIRLLYNININMLTTQNDIEDFLFFCLFK